MADGSAIEWCDATWQPVVGCTRVSAGCDHCYAIGTIHRFRKADGLTKLRPKDAARPGLDWTGKVLLQPGRLADPLRWRRSRRIFVCSQADLFHDQVPFEFIAAAFGVMAAAPRHTFLVLTKRPERAREFFEWLSARADELCPVLTRANGEVMHAGLCGAKVLWPLRERTMFDGFEDFPTWPLPNVHLGVSVEDQATADERVRILLDLPAAVHWVSAEPLLGHVRLDWAFWRAHLHDLPALRWIVIGGESGPRARPFDIEWARDLAGYATGAGCKVFVKQLGSRVRAGASEDERRHDAWRPGTHFGVDTNGRLIVELEDYAGGDMSEWPADLRVREVPT